MSVCFEVRSCRWCEVAADGFLNLTAFLLCKSPFYETHTCLCVSVCDCVHVFVLILDILCQFSKTLNNPRCQSETAFHVECIKARFHHVRTHLATKSKISK